MRLAAIIIIAFVLDLIIGDPSWIPHPIRGIGYVIKKSENYFRKKCSESKNGLLVGGALTVIATLVVSTVLPWGILVVAGKISSILSFVIEVIMCSMILATKSLKEESLKVYEALNLYDINNSRRALSWIVGRDTSNLNEQEIARATIETVAENTTDGVVAPLIFMAIGGAPLGFLYKAVNTMDSMLGYKNDKYLYFGRVAARLDDACNYLPARITGIIMVLTAFILKFDGKNAWKIFWRDGSNHSSPNSGRTEAACSGALGIRLGGSNYYFGKLVEKPTIGDKLREIENEDIVRANRLMVASSALSVVVIALVRCIF